MSYTINLTDGTIFAVVADGTINNDSSQTLVGKNYAGYGEFLDENFIRLLENAANKYAGERFGHRWLEPRLKTKFVQTTEWSDTA